MIRVMVVRTSWMVRTCLQWEGPAVLLKDGDSGSPCPERREENQPDRRKDTSWIFFCSCSWMSVPCRLVNAAPERRSWSAARLSADGAEAHRTERSACQHWIKSHFYTTHLKQLQIKHLNSAVKLLFNIWHVTSLNCINQQLSAADMLPSNLFQCSLQLCECI